MSTVATLVVRVAGDMKDAEKAFAGLESSGKGLERAFDSLGKRLSTVGSDLGKGLGGAFTGLEKSAGTALGAVEQGLGKVSGALGGVAQLLPGMPRGIEALASAFGGFIPLPGILGGVAGALGAVAAVSVGIVGGLVALGKSAADAGDELLVLSQQSGISVENLSRFQYIEQQTDASVDKIVGSIRKLGTNLATGSKESSKAIEGIGLSLSSIRNLKPEEAFTQIVDGLGKIPDAGRRAAAGAAIFGKGWHDVSQLATEDLRGLMKEADVFGATISTELAIAGDAFNDTMGQLSTLFEGFKRAIGTGVLPVMTAFAEALRDTVIAQMRATGTTAATLESTFEQFALKVGLAMLQIISSVSQGLATLVTFFSSRIISDSPLYQEVEKFLRLVGALESIKPGEAFFSSLAAIPEKLREIDRTLVTEKWVDGIKEFESSIQESAATVAQSADKMGRELPARLGEIHAKAIAAAAGFKETQGAMTAFGAAAGPVDDAMKKLIATLSGTAAATAAGKMIEAFERMRDTGVRVTREGAAQIKDALDKWFDALRSTGQKIPEAAQKIWLAMLPPPEFDHKWLNAIKALPTPTLPVPRMAADLQRGWDQIGRLIKWETFPAQAEQAFKNAKWGAFLADWSTHLVGAVTRTVADMLTGLRTFEEGFKDIWRGIQSFGSSIINEVLVSFTKPLVDGITDSFKNIKWSDLGKQGAKQGALAGAVVGAAVGVSFAQAFGAEVGIIAGIASGALTGGLIGGPPGAIVGGVVGGVSAAIAAIEGQEQQQAAIRQTRHELELAHGGLEQLRATAERVGVSFEHLWETDNVDEFQAALNELNRQITVGAARVKKLGGALQEVSRSGALMTDALAHEIALTTNIPGQKETVFAFLQDQANAAGKGIETFLANTQVKTQAGATAIGASLASLYDELIRQGARPSEAFRQLEPAIASLQAQLAAAGLQAPAVFQPLADLARLSADAIGGPLLDAMAGLGEGLTAMHNLGLLNQETFSGFAAEVSAGFKALEAMGQGGIVAVQGMRGPLQKLWELQKDFGYTVTEDEQKLLDFAEAGGVIGDKFRPAADRMVTAIEALVKRLDTFLARIFDLPAAAGTAASGIESEFGNITIPPIEIQYEFVPINDLPGGGGTIDVGVPALARGGIVRAPTLALIGEKGPEAVVPLNKDFRGGGTTEIYLDGDLLTRVVTQRQPRVLRAYGAVR